MNMGSKVDATAKAEPKFRTVRNAFRFIAGLLMLLVGLPGLIFGFGGLISGDVPSVVADNEDHLTGPISSALISGDQPGLLALSIVLTLVAALVTRLGWRNAGSALRVLRPATDSPTAAADPAAQTQLIAFRRERALFSIVAFAAAMALLRWCEICICQSPLVQSDVDVEVFLAVLGAFILTAVFATQASSGLTLRTLLSAWREADPGIQALLDLFFVAAFVMLLYVIAVEFWAQKDSVMLIKGGSPNYSPRGSINGAIYDGRDLEEKVTAFYQEHRRLPQLADAAAIQHTPSRLRSARSAVWEPAERRILVTVGMPRWLSGKRFALHVEERSGTLGWTCRSIDLNPKYLRESCR